MEIRTATASDLAALAAVEAACFPPALAGEDAALAALLPGVGDGPVIALLDPPLMSVGQQDGGPLYPLPPLSLRQCGSGSIMSPR